ncbi:UpxY family transcription antiterminator [Mucilaginibacter sp. 21P]|uniref:UpxY family transcription antiterminator n=1 Tax=Mucilaginibacter sp. 21P TaxID=2778902 RepID=UPI001C592F98|nr:UpxY family transcription antiterminator [Mucilaginibacter sp. 21P]QXV63859.1 UpxY family transcription antiterminator [Mucilaginibacter sp. 21P]
MENCSENKIAQNWYVAYTFPNYEKKVEKLLSQKKIDCYLPLQKVIKQWSDRKKRVECPLFPNYIFINTTAHERFDALNTEGVLRFVSFGGQPAVLSSTDIDAIRKIASYSVDIECEHGFEKGDYVIITQGPFSGMKGYLFSKRGRTRFGFKMDAIDQHISIEICTSMIEKIEFPN